MNQLNQENLQIFMKEHEILKMLNHPNVLKTYGIFLSDETNLPSILLEHCVNDLDCAIKNKSLSKTQISFIIYQMAEGMKYFHFKKIIHCDLKPSDILIDENGIIKICDFCISKVMTPSEQQTLTMTGGL
ncbi:hypothetical protein M9Y10_025808 [Tritrichomonas musculus]|uniref:Protein kinase domain-containing protein n=1 Tax=Tritrichomonas musculus TaxID=1915356 RepID=A0ABR2HBM1_9EUKA